MFFIYLTAIENDEERNTISDFYESEKALCLHIAMGFVHNQHDAEEIVQNAFIKIIEHKDIFFEKPRNKQRALILTIVKQRATDFLRTRHTTEEFWGDDGEEIFASDYDISAEIEDEEALAKITEGINTLPESYKTVFELRYIQDMKNGEIAEALGIKKEIVALRLFKGRQKLINILKSRDKANEANESNQH